MDDESGPRERALGQLDSSCAFAAIPTPGHATSEAAKEVLQIFP
jgi:hypothetical protein